MWPKFGAKFEEGWMALVRRGARLDLAHVIAPSGKRPQIEAFDSFALGCDETDALLKLRQARGLKRFRCTTLLAQSGYSLIQIEAPAVPVEERAQALRWRLKDAVDFPVDTAALGVVDIPTEGNRQASVFAIAAPVAVIGEQMTRFQQAKLPLEAIDVPEMALRNVAALFEEANRGLAFLMLNNDESLLVITYRGELCLSRRIEMSAAAVSPDDLDRRLQMRERLALELQRTLDNFDRQFGFVSVSRLIVATEKDSAGLTAALAENLYIPVVAMNLADVADFAALPELQQPERQAQGVLAIGAALRTAA
ncbi:MAG: agglutinin biogenesis protein MshI [Betaproteobacteria bacterium HGW-Betaproteobacteria-12]|nr:MAG: agglutinin biogenesis protein MshI [Betaproteobacteria bacterium HGW-Betaproteobacteria-12]